MASKVHKGFRPHFECLEEKDNAAFIIKVHFPGFVRKEQLKVQLIGKPTPHELRIRGGRKSGSNKIWDRFEEEFPVPADCDTDAITAKLENGILWVTLPRKAPSAQEKAQEQTKTSQATTRVAPPEPKPLQPQNPIAGAYGKEAREKASSEAVRGAEKRESSEPAVPQAKGKADSEEVPKLEESKSHTPQAKPTELMKDEKSETGRSSEEGKSSENTAKREGYDGTCLETNMRRHGKNTLNLGLVVLAAIGIGLYVKNIYDY